jgi:murein DD-endopeptidase MepM/ murein hydrolase activator NlpD
MRRPRLGLGILVALAGCLCGAPSASAERPVIVDLSARVPSRWLTDHSDRMPLTPLRWRERVRPECRTRGGYRRFCQGRRDVPSPFGPAAELARVLGLGHRATAMQLMTQRPFPEWIHAVRGEDPDELLTFPVPAGHHGRGFAERGRRGEVRRHRHEGLDIGAAEGSAIVAARGGLVVYSDDGLTGFGNVVMILHREGFTTMYAHCRRTLVFAGQHVARGQRIAEVGRTGFAPAPHLHFEWRQRGWARDPAGHFHPRR